MSVSVWVSVGVVRLFLGCPRQQGRPGVARAVVQVAALLPMFAITQRLLRIAVQRVALVHAFAQAGSVAEHVRSARPLREK
eukprot:15446938-Alexandrium_andersonii.AAC.1